MRYYALIWMLLVSSQALAADKLLFALDLIRHGDRTPIYSLPASKHEWPQGGGQLTTIGMEQEYQLGIKFRKKYIDETHLLPKKYSPSVMYVRSTNTDRTLMSAQALLLGLYPQGTGNMPSGHTLIPIHTLSWEQDEIVPYHMLHGELSEKFFAKHAYTQKEWLAKKKQISHKFATWSKMTGLDVADLHQVYQLGDTLFIHQQHQAPLPDGLSDKDVEGIILHGKWAFAASFKPKAIGSTIGGGLLTTVTDYVRDAGNKKSPLKYVLLSGHDSSILTLLSAMHAPAVQAPPYASVLNVSLYEDHKQKRYVKVTLNDKPVSIPHCAKRTVCTLAEFSELIENTKPHVDHEALKAFQKESHKAKKLH